MRYISLLPHIFTFDHSSWLWPGTNGLRLKLGLILLALATTSCFWPWPQPRELDLIYHHCLQSSPLCCWCCYLYVLVHFIILTNCKLPVSFVELSQNRLRPFRLELWSLLTTWKNVLPKAKTTSFQYKTVFLRAIAECFARISYGPGVCLSVRLSATLLYCAKTLQARITKPLLWAAPRTIVYRDKISCPCVRSSSWTKASKEVPPKNVILPLLARLVRKRLQISTDMLLIITSTGHWLFCFINIDDFERSEPPQIRGFRAFVMISSCNAHFKTELRRND